MPRQAVFLLGRDRLCTLHLIPHLGETGKDSDLIRRPGTPASGNPRFTRAETSRLQTSKRASPPVATRFPIGSCFFSRARAPLFDCRANIENPVLRGECLLK